MRQKIIQSGNPILRTVSKDVEKVDKRILKLIQDLKDTLAVQKEPEGVGLAAPQIGRNLRVFIAQYKQASLQNGKEFNRVVVNPKIIEETTAPATKKGKKSKNEILEGCLSLPFYYGPLKRSKSVKLEYMNEKGEKVIETFTDFNAQIILHEIDPLNGILFIDHLLQEKKPLYKVENDEWEEVELT